MKSGSLKILVIDDEPGIRTLVAGMLSEEFEVETADSVDSGIVIFHKFLPDIIISDIKMPQKDGLQLLDEINKISTKTPVILMSGHADKQLALDAIKKNAFDLIEKPFEEEDLILSVSRATNHIQLETKLSDTQSQLSSIIDHMSDGLCVVTIEGSYLLVNQQAKDILGFDPTDKTIEANKSHWPFDFTITDSISSEEICGEESTLISMYYEKDLVSRPIVLSSKDKNTKKFISTRISPLHHAKAIILQFRDITDETRKEKEYKESLAQLTQASKLASLGTMAAGIAHEINNPMTTVKGMTELLYESTSLQKNEKQMLNTVIEQCERITKIVRRLGCSSRKSDGSSQQINVNNTITDALELFNSSLELDNIDVSLNLCREQYAIDADPISLESIFQNLIINSHDAFLDQTTNEDRKIQICTSLDEEQVNIRYQDNAGGISSEITEKIFEPFFTTKEMGKGTGLGMSLTYTIVKEHKGSIKVKSDHKNYTIFDIKLPLSRKKSSSNKTDNQTVLVHSDKQKKPKILIVDDEIQILKYLSKILEPYFEVTTIDNAKGCLQLAETKAYDLILSDIRMPNISGIELIKLERSKGINTPVILMTGNLLSDSLCQEGLALGALDIITKPFKRNEIINLLNQYTHKS